MSSDQFSEKPLTSEKVYRCHCGDFEPSTAGSCCCWRCAEEQSIQEGTITRQRRRGESPTRGRNEQSLTDGKVWTDSSVLAILLCVSLALDSTGILAVAFIVLAAIFNPLSKWGSNCPSQR